ncbi:hypothetical protein BDR04DRAFT_1100506, partial [Suillus decipiens]
MIPFYAFHLPMPQHQPPVEPLIWIVSPSSLNIDEKILGVLKILCGLCMTVSCCTLSCTRPPRYLGEKLFFKAGPLSSFSMCWMLTSKQVSNFMSSYDQLLKI